MLRTVSRNGSEARVRCASFINFVEYVMQSSEQEGDREREREREYKHAASTPHHAPSNAPTNIGGASKAEGF